MCSFLVESSRRSIPVLMIGLVSGSSVVVMGIFFRNVVVGVTTFCVLYVMFVPVCALVRILGLLCLKYVDLSNTIDASHERGRRCWLCVGLDFGTVTRCCV